MPSGPDEATRIVCDVFARGCTSRATMRARHLQVGHRSPCWRSARARYRFNALRRRIDGVSERMLSQTLQTLERDGMLTREVLTAIPPRVEYSLTPLGARVATPRGLADLLEASVPESQPPATPTGPRPPVTSRDPPKPVRSGVARRRGKMRFRRRRGRRRRLAGRAPRPGPLRRSR